MSDASITLRVVVTLEDQVRVTEFLVDQPRFRRRRLITYLGIVVAVPVLGTALGATLAWLDDRSQSWLEVLRGILGPHWLANTWPLLAWSGLMVLLFTGQRLVRPWRLRRRLRRVLLERPGVDPQDPLLGEPATMTLGSDGFVSVATASTVQLQWPAIKGLAELRDQFLLRTGELTGYVIPKRDLDPNQMDAVRAIIARHASAKLP